MEGKIKIGPVGNYLTSSGNWDTGSHNNIISQIFISHNTKGIMSIQFQFMLDDKLILSDLPGHHHTGTKFDVIALNYPHEYITGISGEYSPLSRGSGYPDVFTLKFTTNRNEYGPYGPRGPSFSCSKERFEFNLGKFRQFGGFYGTSDASGLQCIGVYLQPISIN